MSERGYDLHMPLPLSSKPPTPAEPVRAVRCTGRVRNGPRTGEQCTKLAILGHEKCLSHGAQLPSVRKFAAEYIESKRLELVHHTDDAICTILDVLKPGVSDAVRLKAATEILDRVGIRGGTEISVSSGNTEDPAVQLRDRLNRLRETTGVVIDGETYDPHEDRVSSTPSAIEGASDHAEDSSHNPGSTGPGQEPG